MSRIAPTDHEPVVPEDRRAFRQADVEQAFEEQNGLCNKCPTPLGQSYIRDHILPRDLDGPTTLANLQLLCADCDRIKTADDRRRIDKARRMRIKFETPLSEIPGRGQLRSRGFDNPRRRFFEGQG